MGGAQAKTEAGLLGRWAGLGSKQKRSYWGGGCDWRESRGGVTLDLGAAGERAEEELLGRSERIGGKHMRSYWGGGLSYSESRGGVTGEVNRAGMRQRSLPGHKARLSMVGAAKMAPEWQLCSCRDGVCQPDKRHRGREGLGLNHVRDAQSSGETLGLRGQVFEHQH